VSLRARGQISAFGLVATVLAFSLAASACTTDRSPPAGGTPDAAPPEVHVTSLQDLSQLRDRFNEDAGQVRLVLLLSPT
jgi:hypothetical protein